MNTWWESLNTLQKFFYYIAIPSTLVLVIQTILTLIGIGDGGDANVDIDIDSDFDSDLSDTVTSADFKFISIRGILSFLTIFGWTGVSLSSTNMPPYLIIIISTIAGLIAMIVVALLFYAVSKMQSNGVIRYKNALGCNGEVYIPIPANKKGIGKIQVTIQERLVEVDAMTTSNKPITTGSMVRVIDIINNHILIVEKI
ncbi:MAG: hypothetical protein N4A63_04265 [Vallitalea sp.]|jgi:membrane protein implicated in regulation of membrane protease activity|nr:hypothetical protein [Vallitalea sp.]